MAGAHPRAIAFTIIVLLLLYYSNTQPSSSGRQKQIQVVVGQQRAALHVLNASVYEDFQSETVVQDKWLNLTGFRELDNYAWRLLPEVRKGSRNQLEHIAGREGLDILDGTSRSTLLQYQNVTGSVVGRWVRSRVTDGFQAPHVNLSAVVPNVAYATSKYGRNITGLEGKTRLRLSQTLESANNINVAAISARLTLQDESSYGDGWESTLHGVHFRDCGDILLSTTSEKFAGIFGLPHFALSARAYQLAQNYLGATLTEDINLQEANPVAVMTPWTSKMINADERTLTPLCELIVYLHQNSPGDVFMGDDINSSATNQSQLEQLETELRFPTGRFFPPVPKLQMSMLVFSPDCGFILESRGPPDYPPQEGFHLEGTKIETYLSRERFYILIFIVVLVLQLQLLINQMKSASTPSSRSRISVYTIAILSLGNSFMWLAFLAESYFIDSMFLVMNVVAFLAFLEGSFFGMKFLLDIWTVQEPERTERRRAPRQQSAEATSAFEVSTEAVSAVSAAPSGHNTPTPVQTQPVPSSVFTASDTLPLPVTARYADDTGANALLLPSTQNDAANPVNSQPLRSFGTLYVRFYLLLLFIAFLSISAATSWPPVLRSAYANLLSFLYISFWTPQIYRNITRNCRKALSWTFVVGQSVCRLAPIAYFWGIQDNVLFVETDVSMLIVFGVWLWIQILALVGQQFIGPRFFVSERWWWVPPAWDYHLILRENVEDGTMPLGLNTGRSAQDGPEPLLLTVTESGKMVFECAICMQNERHLSFQQLVKWVMQGGFRGSWSDVHIWSRHVDTSSMPRAWKLGWGIDCNVLYAENLYRPYRKNTQ